MTGKVYAGTSGFAFKEWKGVFYPEGTSDKKMLRYYSTVLKSVEINYTFRRMPSESTLEAWKAETPEDFRFTLKAPQRITHFKRLRECTEDVEEFVRRARLLGERLGTILFQLPPNLSYDADVLDKFLQGLPPIARYAMEFRNASFATGEAEQRLRDHGVAYCGADTDEKAMTEIPVTAGHAYMRLRKEEYAPSELQDWRAKAEALLSKDTDVFCYFKHEDGATGPVYARQMQEAGS